MHLPQADPRESGRFTTGEFSGALQTGDPHGNLRLWAQTATAWINGVLLLRLQKLLREVQK
jgi:hypothetical protein